MIFTNFDYSWELENLWFFIPISEQIQVDKLSICRNVGFWNESNQYNHLILLQNNLMQNSFFTFAQLIMQIMFCKGE